MDVQRLTGRGGRGLRRRGGKQIISTQGQERDTSRVTILPFVAKRLFVFWLKVTGN